MLILDGAQLVVLEMPKTATQALRQALKPHAREMTVVERHGGFRAFKRRIYPVLAKEWGGTVECCCVVRGPLLQAQSWYRYRQRAEVAGTEKSTAGIWFEAYVEALLSEVPPAFIQTGRQARFTGWNGARAKVDHVFDYERLDLLLAFLGGRLDTELKLPRRNQSSGPLPLPLPLPLQLQDRFATAYAQDYALYQAVRSAGGHLQRGAPGVPQTGAATGNQ